MRFVLCVAGEDSGDLLGVAAVQAVRQAGFRAQGSGGPHMQEAGLETLVPYEDLAVCGLGDVLRRLPRLRRHLRTLQKALAHPDCAGLLSIDYPGFNLRLLRLARQLQKPVWALAPPQIWAWKKQRGKWFRNTEVGVFFPFEAEAYQAFGAKVHLLRHPAMDRFAPNPASAPVDRCHFRRIYLLPGSRLPQLLRNIGLYGQVAEILAAQGFEPVFVAARASLLATLQNKLANRYTIATRDTLPPAYDDARGVISPPGTATLEVALAGVPLLVLSRTDLPTWILGKLFLRVPALSLPNLLIPTDMVAEHVHWQQPSKLMLNQWLQHWLGTGTQSAYQKGCELLAMQPHRSIASELATWLATLA